MICRFGFESGWKMILLLFCGFGIWKGKSCVIIEII